MQNASVAASEDHYEPPTSDMVIVLYFHSIYHFTARREVKNSKCSFRPSILGRTRLMRDALQACVSEHPSRWPWC